MAVDEQIMNYVFASGRSWWVLHYRDDSYRYEWQEHVGGSQILMPNHNFSAISEWENTSKKNVIRAMLICPNGQIGGFNEPSLLFQFKKGHASINADNIWCDAHILGNVTDENGECDLISYEPMSNKLITIRDNVNDIKYQNIGKLDTSIISDCR